MATHKFDLVATSGTYTDKQGNEKKRYVKCGVVMENEKGMLIKIESLPIGFNGWLSCFEPKGAEDRGAKRPAGNSHADIDDQIPF